MAKGFIAADVSQRAARWSISWVFPSVAFAAALIGSTVSTSGCGRSTGGDGAGDDATTATASTPDPDAGPSLAPSASEHPRLGEVQLVDLTPPKIRPAAVPKVLDDLVKTALEADFTRVDTSAPDAVGACRASIGVGYALLVNKEPVLVAEAGEARAFIEGELFCPTPGSKPGADDVDEYRVKIDAQRNFGGATGGTSDDQLLDAVRSVIRDGVAGLYGQVGMRHASDAELRATLATSEHPGLLAEAASEAGERHLVDVAPDLARLCGDDNPRVATRAGAALGQLKVATPEVIKALVKMTDGPDPEKHLVAINALADLGTPEAKRYLESLALGHPEPALREVARERLRALGTELGPELRPKDHDPEPVPDPVP